MEIRAHHWLIALMVAGAAHGVLLLVWPTPSAPKPQAEPVYSLRLTVLEPSSGAGADEAGGGVDPEPLNTEKPTLTPPTSTPMPTAAIQAPPSTPTTRPESRTHQPRHVKSVAVAKARKREEPKRPVETRQVRPKAVTAKTPGPSKPAADVESRPTDSGAIASTSGQGTNSSAKGDRTQAGHVGSGRGANDGGTGTGKGVDPANVRRYHATLAAWLARHKRYPEPARRRQEQGTVRVTFSIDRQGRLLSHRIESSSGHPVLDQEVKAMLQRASPMPPIPANLGQSTLTITVPINFSLR